MTSPLSFLPLVSACAALACSSHAQPAHTPAPPAPAVATAPEPPPAPGTVIGELRENHYGVWKEWQPVMVGGAVRFTPDTGWPTQDEAVAALAELAARSPGRTSSVAILAVGDRFVARFLVDQRGGDLRPWHIPLETRAKTTRWVATVDGPTMVVAVSAQSRSLDWCGSYLEGSWGAVPASSASFQPTTDPALLDLLYRRRTRFSGSAVHEWTAGARRGHIGTAAVETAGGTCRVTIDAGGSPEVREYLPETDDSMHLVIPGSSSPLHLVRLTGADAQPPR